VSSEPSERPTQEPKRGFWSRLFGRFGESDEERLAAETREWASKVKGCSTIAEAAPRTQVKLAGVVRRITVRPAHGFESLEAVLDDGTGEIEAVWMGRRTIPGLSLGTHLVVDGVLSAQPKGGRAKMVNPKFEFATPPALK
jgi:hypothetical protein